MASKKEKIEALEVRLGGVQDQMSIMEIGLEKLRHIEETINKLPEVLLTTKARSSRKNDRSDQFSSNEEDHRKCMEGGPHVFISKTTNFEFPRYSGDDPTEWFN